MRVKIGLVVVCVVASAWTARSQSDRSVWDGVYTEAQAVRGQNVFGSICSSCHNIGEFTGSSFLDAWESSTALELFRQLQKTMPMDTPGSLRPEEYADVVTYFFRVNAFPPGKDELSTNPDQLKLIRIEAKKAQP